MLRRVTRSLRLCLLKAPASQRTQRQWLDLLFGYDAWQNILHLASLSPVEAWGKDGNDSEKTNSLSLDETSVSDCSSVEAGRMLYMLLMQTDKSPILQTVLHNKPEGGINPGMSPSAHQFVRTLTYLLDQKPRRQKLVPLYHFVVSCLRQTSMHHVSLFFRHLTIPDPKHGFAYVARIRLVSQSLKLCHVFIQPTGNQEKAEYLVTWPESWKPSLSKALQNSNAMVVSETLKLILVFLELRSQHQTEKLDLNTVVELQVLLSIRSRWNPFQGRKITSESMVIIYLCQVLNILAKTWPRTLETMKFDWIKLLPPNAKLFYRSHPFLQLRLLQTLQAISEAISVSVKKNLYVALRRIRC
jgi:hypothetical protein